MREPSTLQKFAEAVAAGLPDSALEAHLPQLVATASVAEAAKLLRQHYPEKSLLLRRFSEAVEQARQARQASWQHDARKVRMRLQFERTGAAAAWLPAEFLSVLAETFQLAGLELALGLEKRPKPLLQLGHPLPLGAEGLGEYLEAVLIRTPMNVEPLVELNQIARAGLKFLAMEVLPDYATPLLELCRQAEWQWACPDTWRTQAELRVGAFLAAETFQIEKTGKEGGQKCLKKIEVRGLVKTMVWEGATLRFELSLEPGQALHPAKLLGGILCLEPAEIRGLVRTRIDLAADPRLAQAERFEPKLKNMFEDAVLLKAGSNLKLVDEDDDEPLLLG
jgi:hypothetical protein